MNRTPSNTNGIGVSCFPAIRDRFKREKCSTSSKHQFSEEMFVFGWFFFWSFKGSWHGFCFQLFNQLNIETNMIWLKWHDSLLLHSTNLLTCADWVDELFKNHQPIGRPWFFTLFPLCYAEEISVCATYGLIGEIFKMLWVGVGHIFKNRTQKISRNFVRHQCVCHQSWDKHTLVLFLKPLKKPPVPHYF